MTFSMLAGCDSTKPESAETTPETTTEVTAPENQTEQIPTIDYAAAYAKYDPETVVMTLNGLEITWDIYFYWVRNAIVFVNQYYSEIDWAEELDEGYTIEHYVKESAESYIKQYWLWSAEAEKLNIELDEESYAEIERIYQEDIASSGGEAAFAEQCAQNFITDKMYNEMNANMFMSGKLFEHYFGKDAENYSDESAQKYIDEGGFIRAKHILLKTIDDSYVSYSEEDIAAQRAIAEETLAKIRACTSREEMLALFDELMLELSEDPGSFSYPNGYYFVEGEMEENFHKGAEALEAYEVSEIVESFFGYHIILRLPIGLDDKVDVEGNTIRHDAAVQEFNGMYENWYAEATVEYTPDFENISLAELFA